MLGSKKCRISGFTLLIVTFIGASLTILAGTTIVSGYHSGVQAAAVAATAVKCPPTVDHSHPDFVCPAGVLAMRRSLRYRNDGAEEYERLGGANLFCSQFWEDWFLYTEFFHEPRYNESTTSGTPKHTFIELGGYDGKSGSNSYFYDKALGWKGIVLEASTLNYVSLEKTRLSPRVTTIHGAVCRRSELLTLWGGASLTANNREEANGLFHDDNQSISVCLPMTSYIEMVQRWRQQQHHDNTRIERIDYFSMDVEGQELDIILTHDWVRYPVFVVSIEVAVQPLLSGTAEYQHEKRCALYQRGLCRWPFYDNFVPPVATTDGQYSRNNEIWVNPRFLLENNQ
jgi:hypothetical protein